MPAAALSVDTDEGNGTLYWIVTQSAVAPTAFQVEGGADENGDPADEAGSQAVSGTGTQNVTTSEYLEDAVTYYAYFMHKDTAGNRSDVVGSGAFVLEDTGEPPTDITLSNNQLLDNAAIGTIVGFLTVTDPDSTSHTFSIVSDPDSLFEVDATWGELRLTATPAAGNHTVTVRATDPEGNTFDKLFTISVAADGTDYANTLGTGDRTATITASTTATLGAGGGVISNTVDGAVADNGTDSFWWNSGQRGKEIRWDLATTKAITEIKWKQSTTTAYTGVWLVQGSHDASLWRTLTAEFTLGGATEQLISLSGNPYGYRYYRIISFGGLTSSTPWNREVEFQIDAGITAPVSTDVPHYDNPGGRGARASVITISTDLTFTSGSVAQFIDGLRHETNSTNTLSWTAGQSGKHIKFDFGDGNDKIITEITFRQLLTDSHGTWKLQGSANDADWTDIGAGFTLGGAEVQTITEPSANKTAYRYYRMLQTAGTTAATVGSSQREIEFKIAA